MPVPEWAGIALSAADALAVVNVLDGCTISSAVADKLRDYVRTVARLGGHLMFLAGEESVPPAAWGPFASDRTALFSRIAHALDLQQQRVEQQAGVSAAAPAPMEVRSWSAPLREKIRALSPDTTTSLAGLGQLYRHEQSAACASEADGLSRAIPFEDVFSDRIL